MKEHINVFLRECEGRSLSKTTMKAYRTNLRQFSTFLESYDGEISGTSVSAYISSIREEFKPSTVNQKIATVSLFLDYLVESQVIPENPIKELEIRQEKQEQPCQTVGMDVIAAILRQAYHERDLSSPGSYAYRATLRDIAVLELLFYTGMRISELCQLGYLDISLETRSVTIEADRYRKRVLQIQSEETLQALAAYQKEFWSEMVESKCYFVNRDGRGLSEQSVRILLNRYAELAHIDQPITPKVLRDSVATALAGEGVDLATLQQMLGLSDMERTQRYVQIDCEGIAARHPRRQMIV